MRSMDLIVNDTRFDGNDVALGLELLALITAHYEKMPAWEAFTSHEIEHWEGDQYRYVFEVRAHTAKLLEELDVLLDLRIPRAPEVQAICPKKQRSSASMRKTPPTGNRRTHAKT